MFIEIKMSAINVRSNTRSMIASDRASPRHLALKGDHQRHDDCRDDNKCEHDQLPHSQKAIVGVEDGYPREAAPRQQAALIIL